MPSGPNSEHLLSIRPAPNRLQLGEGLVLVGARPAPGRVQGGRVTWKSDAYHPTPGNHQTPRNLAGNHLTPGNHSAPGNHPTPGNHLALVSSDTWKSSDTLKSSGNYPTCGSSGAWMSSDWKFLDACTSCDASKAPDTWKSLTPGNHLTWKSPGARKSSDAGKSSDAWESSGKIVISPEGIAFWFTQRQLSTRRPLSTVHNQNHSPFVAGVSKWSSHQKASPFGSPNDNCRLVDHCQPSTTSARAPRAEPFPL